MKFTLFALLLVFLSGCGEKIYSGPGIGLYLPDIDTTNRYEADEYDSGSDDGMMSGG